MEYLDIPELIEELNDIKWKVEDCLDKLNKNKELDSTQIGFLQSINIQP